MATPIVIKDWQKGIADSPYLGNAMIKFADIEANPGSVMSGKSNTSWFAYRASNTRTFTADAGTDVCTASGNMHATAGTNYLYTAVTLTTTGTLPAGLSLATTYFLIYVSDTTFKIATTLVNAAAGTGIDITDTGTGTHTITPTPVGTINWIVKDPSGNGTGGTSGTYYALDSNQRVWRGIASNVSLVLLKGNTLTNGVGSGMVLHNFGSATTNYLFVFRPAAIDVIDVFDATAVNAESWTNGWQTLNTTSASSNSHHAIVGQDDIIYFCDSQFVGSIKEASGQVFAPGTGSTYVFNSTALDLPSQEVAQSLEELGANLLIGGNTFNKIYPWDRISPSFSLPIHVPEKGIKFLKNIGNEIFILAGVKGNIYSTFGVFVKHVKKIPDHLVNNATALTASPVTWGSVAALNGSLIFGLSGQTSANNGLYRLFPDGRLSIETTPSTGAANVTAIHSDTEYFYFGYSGGADFVATSRYTNFQTILQSPIYRLGGIFKKETYTKVEVQTATPATSGSIRVSYRKNRTGSFTTIDTFTADSSAMSFSNSMVGITDIENLQIQIEMHGNFELLEVRLT